MSQSLARNIEFGPSATPRSKFGFGWPIIYHWSNGDYRFIADSEYAGPRCPVYSKLNQELPVVYGALVSWWVTTPVSCQPRRVWDTTVMLPK